jgi:cell division protein FtsB
MVRVNKSHQAEPEIREDFQGRIEVFDQSIRSFEKRLRAVERRLSMGIPPGVQAGRIYSGNLSGFFPERNEGSIAAGSSAFPRVPSVSPESPIRGNSFLSDLVPSTSEGHISSFGFSAVLPSGEPMNPSMAYADNSSEVSGTGYKIKNINEVFSSIAEGIRSLHATISELSNFTHNSLEPEIEKLNTELRTLKAQEETKNKYIKELESRIKVLESQNRLTFGSMKIPFEISGAIGSSALFLTALLIWAGRWDVIRSPYFSIGLAVLMAGAVVMKFYMANRREKTLAGKL